jgi:hypothetical protein
MGVTETSPSVPRRDGEGALKKQVVKLYPIASNGPRLGGLTHGHTFWIALARDSASSACVTEAG